MSQDQERTLKPTQKRVDEFRKRGEVALSKELAAAGALLGGVIVGLMTLPQTSAHLSTLWRASLGGLDGDPRLALHRACLAFAGATLPVGIGAVIGWVVCAGLQIGWPPALQPPKVDFTRIFSLKPFTNLLSPKEGAMRTAKAVAKVALVGGGGVILLLEAHHQFLSSPTLGASELGARLIVLVRRLVLLSGGALGGLALLDYFLSKRTINNKMKMSREEYKREFRESEGDPMIRRRRRQRMRELARRRLTSTVKTADVVLVNPTEYAVALRYVSGEDRAPRVVAKGRGAVAERIRELARQAGIPIVAEPPLTRLIHKTVKEGAEIPSALFHAVAEVLAYVYKLRAR